MWWIFVSRSQLVLWVSFSGTDSGLCKYHLSAWPNFILSRFFASIFLLLHSLIKWLNVSSLSPHILLCLFFCILQILFFITITFMFHSFFSCLTFRFVCVCVCDFHSVILWGSSLLVRCSFLWTIIIIIKVFRTIVFIFIVISTTFRSICPPVFFRCLSNSGTFTEFRTTSFIETTGVACSDSVSQNRVQVLSIPVYYSPVVKIEPATFGGHISRNVVEITIKMKTIVRKTLMIKINKLRLRNLDNYHYQFFTP